MENDYRRSNNRTAVDSARSKRVRDFKLNIDQDNLSVGERYRQQEGIPERSVESINSYSHDNVRTQMEKNSRNYHREQKKEQKKQQKMIDKTNRRIFKLVWWVSVAIVGIMLAVFLIVGMNDMLAVERTSSDTVTVELPANPSAKQVSEILEKNGVINEPGYFEMYANLTGSGNNFRQGTYEIKKNMDYEAIINYLQSMANRTDTVKVTIPEGESVKQIAKTLKKAKVIDNVDEFLELCNSDYFDEDYKFLRKIKNDDQRYYKLEGYLFPDTYECYINEDPKMTITRMLNAYEMRIYNNQNVDGYTKIININKLVKESGQDLDTVMTIASIIQAEAANADDMYYISSVIHNRLEADVDLGVSKLDMDSTYYYPYHSASNVPDNIKDTFKSRYNTYEIIGLPPGPICNPGMEAILAAIYPNDTSYLYFCHGKDGTPYYASTFYQHNINLAANGYI